jgi:acetylornithine/N-succinyldiaminopimelate aminotransferase
MTVTEGRTEDASAKAATLIEALPWLNKFHGQTVVIKYGGHAMADEALRLAFAQDLVFLRYAGLRPVVVHGGGPQITEQLDRLGVESTFTAGLRVTTPEAMEVVRMVLSGKVNKDIVGMVNRHGPFAVGLSGEDAGTFTAARKMAVVDGVPVDIGQVGDIVATDPGAIEALLADGRIPVVSSVAAGRDGEVYNVNADTAAAALAVALNATKLVVLTDVAGLYRDWPSSADVISELTAAELERLLPALSAGMIPKMEACLTAVRGGVPQAHVLDGRLSHAVLLEIFTDSGIGTMVLPGEGATIHSTHPSRKSTPLTPPVSPLHPLPQVGHFGYVQRYAMSETEALQKRFSAALMPNYGVPSLAISRGQGCRVWDPDGNQYLDLIAGIAVSSLGHAHPAIVGAVSRQVAEVAHTSNLFLNEPAIELAERILVLLSADGRVFFANSGAEANEAAIKLVRRLQGPGRPVMVAAERSFHGRTMGSLALTGKESIRAPFGPFGLTVRFVPYGDADALRAAVDADVAAVFLEPGLGESGVIPAPAGYLRAAREACDQTGALLVLDEIQTGIGRTGVWFAHQAAGVRPDVLTLAKGLGGGLAVGACVGLGPAGAGFARGDHGSTFGGNPVACAAALAVLDTIERDGLLAHVTEVGEHLAAGLDQISHPLLAGVRGAGLWRAVMLTAEAAPAVEGAARRAGFLVNAVQPDAIRLAPPLILSAAEADEFTTALPGILAKVSA